MDFSKNFNISVDYKDRRSPLDWQMFLTAEIIFIDRTHNALQPKIYQLKDGVLPSLESIIYQKPISYAFPSEAFCCLGEAVSIDRKKKQILLSSQHTVAYHHLIIASGTKAWFTFEDEKFDIALQALIEAIRMKQKIPSSFAVLPSISFAKSKPSRTRRPSERSSQKPIKIFAQPYMCQTINMKAVGRHLHAVNKRLYEVQL